ncbi:uncharacterized protein L203_101542 [Cryptococcus depauperatus CBS 7841]|uniref:Uncharacterized protein n=1 Tax=Cryptococcus depauperatus CBS 7841 TaxID=1295531 RepID=A0A1E3IVW4_9TREE|nr:endoplasmic oxidoreductin 1 [Cryptococcus depauperatus CBS 7841]
MRISSTIVALSLVATVLAQTEGSGRSYSSPGIRSERNIRGRKPESRIARNVLEGKSEGYCSPSGPIESTHCLYETMEALNQRLYPALHELVTTPFFKHYKVDLYKECPFWYENGFCMNRNCGVEELDENEIPEKWRVKALSEVRISPAEEAGISSCYFKEQDFCHVEDDADTNGRYVDLTLNPERFTGYAGQSAQNVWRAIYEENCFGLSEASLSESSVAGVSGLGGKDKERLVSTVADASGINEANGVPGWGFSKLSEGWGTEMVKAPMGSEEMCEEKKVYYRVISGLHASISIHICAEYLNQTTGEWAPNLDCFISRLASHPERLSNVYFNAVLLLRAVERAEAYLEAYDISTSQSRTLSEGDQKTKSSLRNVLDLASGKGLGRGFDEGDFFTGPDAGILKEQFKTHFRNVSRIMDCVGCDKCRLWGKLQVSGIGTALKILFELDERALDPKVNPDLLQRSEVVALFNTLHRVSESLAAVEQFRQIYAATQRQEAGIRRVKTSRVTKNKDALTKLASASRCDMNKLLNFFTNFLNRTRESCLDCLDACLNAMGSRRNWDLDSVRRWIGRIGQGRDL